MLKALFLPLTTLALPVMVTAQNLVPNPSFEDTIDCNVPTQCSLLKATGWFNPNIGATPDVWDCDLQRLCGYTMDVQNPDDIGAQYAQHGTRFAGAFLWYGPGTTGNDYLMSGLASSLVPGQAYEVSLHYSLVDGFVYGLDHIGVWFGTDSVNENSTGRLELVPQVELRDPQQPYLVNMTQWVRLVDTLVADAAYSWMIIGNFAPADSINATVANSSSNLEYAYYFIDSVVVRPVIATSLPPMPYAGSWNGQTFLFEASGGAGSKLLEIWDTSGRLVASRSLWMAGGKQSLPSPELPAGVYVASLTGSDGRCVFRFVKGEGGL